MQKLLLVLLVLHTSFAFAQRGYLNIKKKGYKKVRSYAEGSAIQFQTKYGTTTTGYIALIQNDSIMVNSNWYLTRDITRITIRGKVESLVPFLWTTAGVALSTAGMTLAEWGSFEESLRYSAIIGYGSFLIRFVPSFIRRKHYNIGRKFTLQTIDLHFQAKR